jgi:hypothetical protein
MGKYDSLGSFLRDQKASAIPMTFVEVERVIGHPLPRSSQYPAWWSNNPSNNVMTQVWLDAGFKTEHVDVAGKKLVFRRVSPLQSENEKSSVLKDGYPPFYGSMKGLITIMPGVDLAEPADPEWADLLEKKYGKKL